MKRLLTIFRNSLHTIAIALVAIVVALYVSVHFNLAGMAVEHSLTEELAEKLQTRVTLDGDVEVDWLNQVVLNRVTLYDQHDDTLLYARRVLVAFDVLPLLKHHLVLNTCQLIDFDLRASRDSVSGEHNFQFIVDALSKQDPNSTSFIQELDLNAILLRKGNLRYGDQVQISQFNANLHLHDQLLQAKKVHFLLDGIQIRAGRYEMVLDPQHLKQLDEHFRFTLQGLALENNTLRCQADVEGQGRRADIHLHHLSYAGPLPSLPQMRDLQARAELSIADYTAPADQLQLRANIQQASATVERIGATSLSALIEGTPTEAAISCQANTSRGDAILKGTLLSSNGLKDFRLKGHCNTSGFDLAPLLPSAAEVGMVALDADFDLQQQQPQPLAVAMQGCVKRLDFRRHTYRDLLIEGRSQGKMAEGRIQLADSLGDVDLAFDLDLQQRQPHYRLEGDIRHLQPVALNLVKHQLLDSIAFSGHLNTDIYARQWNDAEGIFNLTQLMLQRGDERLALEPILFEGKADRGMLTSQMLHLEYQRDRHDHMYHLKGELPVANEVYRLLRLPVSTSSIARFEATFDASNQLHEAWLNLPNLHTDNNQEISANATVRTGEERQLLPVIDLHVTTPDHAIAGTLKGEVRLSPLEVTLFPTTFIYNNEELNLRGGHMIRTEEGNYAIQNCYLQGANQSISAAGVVGSNGHNDLVVQLQQFDLSQVFDIFNKGYLKFAGQATGDIVLSSNPLTHLKAEGLYIENFCYIDTLLGDARLDLDFILPTRHLDVECEIMTDRHHVTQAGGSIQLGAHDSLNLYFNTNQLPLGFINYWTGGILQDFSGKITGPARLYGDTKALQLAGDPVVDGYFTHNIIGAHFHLNDTVHLEENLLTLRDVTVDDCHDHTALLNARVTHQHLTRFGYDVDLEMPEANQGFLALDREQTPGRTFWGQLYVSGHANLRGGDGHHRFNLNVATTDKSWFYLSPFEQDFTSDNGSSYSFLTFRDKATLLPANQTDQPLLLTSTAKAKTQEESKTDLQVDMMVNATDQCQVTVQLDPLAEDRLICRGSGDLAVHYDPRRDITLAGTYHISSGTYGMSMKGDLMSKVFQLQNTSSVRFSGVPSEAELALDARYSIPSVNLTDLDESITTLGSLSRSTVPVDCMLAVTGQLSTPQVSFDLEVKNVSEEIQAYVHNVIGTQEMLNQEVLYLLLFSKFYTPQYAQSTQSRSGSEITSFASASITSQLNQLLGHVSNNFTMGTNFRTDRGDFSDMEMDVSLSTRLLGDRLLLNGNVGYRDPANRLGGANSSNSFIGDFDLEFLINNSGTVRAKAYSHYNERDYSINNALTTQGIGFILRKDFQTFHDIWRRKK